MPVCNIDVDTLNHVPLNDGFIEYAGNSGYCAVGAMAGACGVDVDYNFFNAWEWRDTLPESFHKELCEIEDLLLKKGDHRKVRKSLVSLANKWNGKEYTGEE